MPVNPNAAVCPRCGARFFSQESDDWVVPPTEAVPAATSRHLPPPQPTTRRPAHDAGPRAYDAGPRAYDAGQPGRALRPDRLSLRILKYGFGCLLIVVAALVVVYLLLLSLQYLILGS
ncbi:MAG: hypothetical protein ABSA21_03675 [Candidatus Limnocylindrales bacterium]